MINWKRVMIFSVLLTPPATVLFLLNKRRTFS